MATNARDVTLKIGVKVDGTSDVDSLANAVDGVSTAGKSASPAMAAMGAELTRLEASTKGLRAVEAAALAEVKQQRTARDELRDALARLRITTDATSKTTDDYKAKEQALKLSLLDSTRAIREKATALDAASTSARVAAAAEAKYAEQVRDAHRQAAAAASDSAAKQRAANTTVGESLGALGNQIRNVQALAATAIGGQMLGGLAGDLAKTSDAFANMGARIKLVTGDGAAFNAAFNGVFDVATRTSTAVDQTATLFTRLAEAGKQVGISNADALRLTESINQAVQISGASAESSSAAITQLIQGLQSGVLRGDELNSTLEQAPRLAKAMADGLGVTTGELRKLGEAGALTAQAVIGSLQGQSAALQSEFNTLPATVGRALQNVSNEWTRYVGEVDKAHGVSAAAAAALNGLATHLDTLGSMLYSAGKAAAAYQAIKLAGTFLEIGTAARVATAEVVALNAAQVTAGAAGATAAAGAGRLAGALSTIKLGALALVVTNLKEIGTAIGESVAKWNGAGKAIAQLEANLKAEEAATRASAVAKAELAQKTQLAADKALGLNDISRKVIGDFDELVKKGSSVTDALDKVAKSLELDNLAGIANAGAALDALAVKGKASAADIQTAYSAALKGIDLGAFTTQAAAAFDNSEQGARRLQAVIDASLREAIRRTGLEYDTLAGSVSKASRSAINDTDAIIKGLDKLKEQGVDTGRVLLASIGKSLNTADGQQAIEALRSQIESLRTVLGDKVTDGLLEQATLKSNELKDAVDKATPGVNSLREAYARLGLQTSEELTNIAAKNEEAWELIRLDATASTDTLKAAFTKYAESAIAAAGNVGSGQRAVTEAVLRTEGAVKGLDVAFDASGKMAVRTQAEAAAAVNKTNERIREQRGNVDDVTSALERQNAAIERSNAALQKSIDLENKRLKQDSSHFATNEQGQRIDAGGNLNTATGIMKFLQDAGVDNEAIAKQITREFLDTQGNVTYSNNPGMLRYGGTTISDSLFKAAERYTFGGGRELSQLNAPAGQQAIAQLVGTPTRGDLPAAQAATPYTPAPAPAPQAAGVNTSHTVAINLGQGRPARVAMASDSDARALVSVLKGLESASRSSA